MDKHASLEFAHLLANATDKFKEYLAEHDPATHGYIVIGIEDGDVYRMSSVSNLDPADMYSVLLMIVAGSRPQEVSDETKTH